MPPFSFDEDYIIQIDTEDVDGRLRERPEFMLAVKKASDFFNSTRFDRRMQTAACLHEGSHLHYTRACGFEPNLFGPAVEYDRQSNRFYPTFGSVEMLPYTISMTADVFAVAKTLIAPTFVEARFLAGDIEIGDWKDLKNFRKWSVCRFDLMGDTYPELEADIREAVYKDCRKPAFRRKLWDAAWEFESRVFGPEAIATREAA